jgi:hypothetical protein
MTSKDLKKKKQKNCTTPASRKPTTNESWTCNSSIQLEESLYVNQPTCKDLESICLTYFYLALNGEGKQVRKGVSANTSRKGEVTGKTLLKKCIIPYNYWRYVKEKGPLPKTHDRFWGGTSEYTLNEYCHLVIIYTHDDNRELLFS